MDLENGWCLESADNKYIPMKGTNVGRCQKRFVGFMSTFIRIWLRIVFLESRRQRNDIERRYRAATILEPNLTSKSFFDVTWKDSQRSWCVGVHVIIISFTKFDAAQHRFICEKRDGSRCVRISIMESGSGHQQRPFPSVNEKRKLHSIRSCW